MTTQPPSLRQWVRDHDEKWLFVVLYLGLAVGLSVLVGLFWLCVVALAHFALELVRQAHYRDGKRMVFLHALWEVKLDVALVLLALTLVLYIEVVLGLLGIQSAARAAAVSRAGARIGTRAAAWERNLRTFLLTVDEMVRVGYAGVMLRNKRRGAVAGEGAEEVDLDEGAPPGLPPDAEDAEDAADVAPESDAGEPPSAADAPPRPASEDPPDASPGPRTPIEQPIWRDHWKKSDYVGLGLVVAAIVLILVAPWFTAHDWGSAGALLLEELRPFPQPHTSG